VTPEPAYRRAVTSELRLRAPAFAGTVFSSIYFGGGTPSLWDPADVAAVCDAAGNTLSFGDAMETTIEVNPGTVDRRRLSEYAKAGVSRVSVGAQSFDAAVLRALGRIHGPDDALAAVGAARDARYAHVGIDLMYGAPGQTVASFIRSVETAAASGADHLSLYALTVHPETPFGRADPAALDLPAEDEVVAMYEEARALLAGAGWAHYEISNWARPGAECVHNVNCWTGGYYLGAGAGAHGHMPPEARSQKPEAKSQKPKAKSQQPSAISHKSRVRYTNVADPTSYVAAVGRGELPTETQETVDAQARARELLYTGLRMMRGVDLDRLAVEAPAEFFEGLVNAAPALEEEGLVRLDGRTLRLTGRGELFADNVVLRLI
jgi:oxygen-independent coproporphyrinogen-3 oxidase